MINFVLFDLDGTLVNSYDSIVEAFKEAFKFLESKNFRVPYKNDDEIRKLIGIPHAITFKKICNDDEIVLKAAEIFRETRIKANVPLMENAIDLLKFLKEKDIKIGVITTSGKIITEKILKECKIYDFFDVIVTRDDIKNPKPSPEPILKAIEILNSKFNNKFNLDGCIMVGDHPNDILCAKNAKIKSVGIVNSHSYEELKRSGADYIVGDLGKLKKLIHKLINT